MENRLEEMTVRAECAEIVCRETQRELLTTILEMCRHEDGSRNKLRKLKHIAEGLTTGRVDPPITSTVDPPATSRIDPLTTDRNDSRTVNKANLYVTNKSIALPIISFLMFLEHLCRVLYRLSLVLLCYLGILEMI